MSLPTEYQSFIHLSRYARWDYNQRRRETWEETIDRYFNFFKEHLKENCNYDLTDKEIKEIRNAVVDLDVMPSMRCLMTSGEALKRENVAGYNCSYVKIDSPRSFDEILYILMNGTGVGFSVEEEFVNKLPVVAEEFHETESVIVVRDSKLGWAKALKELYAMLWMGQVPTWDLSKVRPAGSPLKTFGGRASGPEPLEDLFKFSINIFKNAAGRKLRPVEAHDLVCKIAEIVVVGGVRRSALISLSNLGDREMRYAKSGNWWETNVQRALANNSVNYKEKPDVGTFMREWLSLYDSKSGERGIYNSMSAKRTTEKLNQEKDKDGQNIIRVMPGTISAQILAVKSFYDLENSATLQNALSEDGTMLNLLKRKSDLQLSLEPGSLPSLISSISQESGNEIVMKRDFLESASQESWIMPIQTEVTEDWMEDSES